MGLPLQGTRVLELASAAAAPFCTYWLASLGAEVIKVESYEHLDAARRLEPFADGLAGENRAGMFNSKGINKRSCTLNLGDPRAMDLALRLAALSEVVIENREGVSNTSDSQHSACRGERNAERPHRRHHDDACLQPAMVSNRDLLLQLKEEREPRRKHSPALCRRVRRVRSPS